MGQLLLLRDCVNLLVPAHSTVLPRDVEMKTQLTLGITLNIPLVTTAMDTVTEARLSSLYTSLSKTVILA